MKNRFFSKSLTMIFVFSLLISCGNSRSEDTNSSNDDSAVSSNTVTVDVLEEALNLNNYPDRMKNMDSYSYGYGCFNDYHDIHSNPDTSANIPLDASSLARKISDNGEGITEFSSELLRKYGFRIDYNKTKYELENDIGNAVKEVFDAAGVSEGLDEAKELLSCVNPRIKTALAEFLSASAKAYTVYKDMSSTVTSREYNLLSEFTYLNPTHEHGVINNVYKINSSINEENKIIAGCMMIYSVEKLVAALRECGDITNDGNALIIGTPIGDIIFGTTSDDEYFSPKALLLIDPAGNEIYNGKVAASISKNMPISVLIDVGGNDIYSANSSDGGTQGCGLFGCGILFDLSGDDLYKSVRLSQGSAIHGTGVLFDGDGNDVYEAEVSSQASAYYGYALLVDTKGNDTYYSFGYSQSFASNRAFTMLIDKEGNDSYFVEPYVQSGYDSMIYGDFNGAVGNWSQGTGCGNRGITTSERGLAGGIAGLIDLSGDDCYLGGFWVQGTGYWSGIGFLTDLDGDDNYESLYYCQASAAHYGVGSLIDIGGDDIHLNPSETFVNGNGSSFGFTWDRGVALFVNDGGNDSYTVSTRGLGCAWSEYDDKGEDKQDMTYAVFLDTGGEDYYSKSTWPSYGWGLGGYFFDLGGEDNYEGSPLTKMDGSIYEPNNEIFYGPRLKNGVFYDTSNNEENVKYILGFWEKAKAKYLGN
ncbi:MAG: hypothetical protein E7672_09515 [Ruminococcaceae bacterium]|nr:hypothetical protein [Oscillospiraceae bacterium]